MKKGHYIDAGIVILSLCAVIIAIFSMLSPEKPSEAAVTKANFNRIHAGMEWDAVTEILGPDSGFQPGLPWDFVAVWERNGTVTATVRFENGKVTSKEWRSPGVLQEFIDSLTR